MYFEPLINYSGIVFYILDTFNIISFDQLFIVFHIFDPSTYIAFDQLFTVFHIFETFDIHSL